MMLASSPNSAELVSTTRPAQLQDAITLFSQSTARERSLWLRPASAEAIVGLGAAHVIEVDGPGRFNEARTQWQALCADAAIDDPAHGPLLLGGFRFDPLRPHTSLWPAASRDRLFVPERQYVARDGHASLTSTRVSQRTPANLHRPASACPAQLGIASPSAWQDLVASVARQIRDDPKLDKVVLGRAHAVQAQTPFDIARVLRNLATAYPTCTVFAQSHGDGYFVGATPEVLVSVRDRTAATMALAGSFRRGVTAAEDRALGERLMTDPKEGAEHAFVVDALRSGLSEVSSRVIADAEPRLRQLSNVQHLITRMRGELLPGRGILDVVEQLHPTPAVGGAPSDQALAILRATEELDRGWYAGPLGWTDHTGDGDYVVALRCALIRGTTATLFAGCGIVANSDPATEYAEWGWKLRPMLSALEIDATP